MNLKEAIARFRNWQKTPRQYSDQNLGSHCCANCGHEFTGNYCPICGQNANDGRITWRSVGQSILNVLNMDSRSLPITLWQLLLRPGHLIGEFLNGRRRVCQPPLNTLFAVAVIYVIVMSIFGLDSDADITVQGAPVMEYVSSWLKNHPAWGMMSVTMVMILPTWILFRFAPRNTNHSLPESAFIQIFMSSLMLICALLRNLLPWLFILIPLYYYVTYRQLFGYKFWGTLWRLFACGIVWFSIITLIAMVMFMFEDDNNKSAFLIGCMFPLIIISVILTTGYWISKKTSPTTTNSL